MSKEIMIVDDEPDIAMVLAARFTEKQFNVNLAFSGKDMLVKLNKRKPDLILLDIMLPDITGTEIAAQLRDNPLTAQIPIIFITALADEGEHLDIDESKGYMVFAKPYDFQKLFEAVKKMLSKS